MAKREKDSDSGAGWAVALGLGAAAVGGILYVGKQIYDEVKKNEKAEKKERELHYKEKSAPSDEQQGACSNPWGSSGKTERKCVDDSPTNNSTLPSFQAPREMSQSEEPLQEALLEYYDSYVRIAPVQMRRAQQVVGDIREQVLEKLLMQTTMKVQKLQNSGSEGLKVINADDFDVELILDPEAPVRIIDDVTEDDYVTISTGLRPYFSPEEVRSYFQGQLHGIVNEIEGYDDVIVSTQGRGVTLKVHYDGYQSLCINFLPVISLECGKRVEAKPHPLYLKGNESYAKYWRWSFSEKERAIFTEVDDDGCAKMVLMLLKAVRKNHEGTLGMLRCYHLKTALLHVLHESEADEWHMDALSERFLDCLMYLRDAVRIGVLPHYFVPSLNLLDELSPTAQQNLVQFVQKKISKDKVRSLLRKDYAKQQD